jgi:hypothetical protein
MNRLSMSIENYNGYEFDCTLSPDAEPGRTVTISSSELPNPVNLLVREVKHSMDSHGEKWTTTIKASDLPVSSVAPNKAQTPVAFAGGFGGSGKSAGGVTRSF